MKTVHVYLAAGISVLALLLGGSVAGYFVSMQVHYAIEDEKLQAFIREENARAQSLREFSERMGREKFNFDSPAPAPSPIAASTPEIKRATLTRPIDVKLKYGTAKLPAGVNLKIVSQNDTTLVCDYSGEQITIPVNAANVR